MGRARAAGLGLRGFSAPGEETPQPLVQALPGATDLAVLVRTLFTNVQRAWLSSAVNSGCVWGSTRPLARGVTSLLQNRHLTTSAHPPDCLQRTSVKDTTRTLLAGGYNEAAASRSSTLLRPLPRTTHACPWEDMREVLKAAPHCTRPRRPIDARDTQQRLAGLARCGSRPRWVRLREWGPRGGTAGQGQASNGCEGTSVGRWGRGRRPCGPGHTTIHTPSHELLMAAASLKRPM